MVRFGYAERQIIDKIGKKRERQPSKKEKQVNLEEICRRIDEVFSPEMAGERINPEGFVGIRDYHGNTMNENTIRQDLQLVESKERNFDDIPTKGEDIESVFEGIPLLLEAMIYEQGEKGEWFGSEAYTIRVSRYDDIENGVDLVVEFRRTKENGEETFYYLAIDVTTGSKEGLDEKFIGEESVGGIRSKIGKGELAKVKYFASGCSDYKGSLTNVAKVVAGLDRKSIGELIDPWVNKKYKDLSRHRAQFCILKEIQMQLETFWQYAQRLGKREIAKIYKDMLDIINEVIEERIQFMKEEGQSTGGMGGDKVLDGINDCLETHFRKAA